MEDIEIDDTTKKTMMCPHCDLSLFPKDKKDKFFLFCCQACNHETQLDYEFSWETCKINNQSILPNVKHQLKSTCDPHAIVTAVEGSIRFNYAIQNKTFEKSLSIDDLVSQYEKRMGPDFSWDGNEEVPRTETLNELMATNGVLSDEDFKSGIQTGIRYRAESQKAPSKFDKSCKKILKGKLLHTGVLIGENFNSLGGDDIYIPDMSKAVYDADGYVMSHAIVLVGFGMKNKVHFFRFMNSHGTRFGKKGFGSVDAKEIKSVISFKPLMQ